jgi:hypothetical protein
MVERIYSDSRRAMRRRGKDGLSRAPHQSVESCEVGVMTFIAEDLVVTTQIPLT